MKKKIALLSNVMTGIIAKKLSEKNYIVYEPEGFDTWVQEVVNPASGLYAFKPDAVILLLDGTEAREWENPQEAKERITIWKQGVQALIKGCMPAPVFISTVDFRESQIRTLAERREKTARENDWYQFIQGLSESTEHVYVFDLKEKIADAGRSIFYSDKMWYLSSMPYSRAGIEIVCEEIELLLESAFAPRKKAILLDLDNTLWGGVIGEDGVEGIELSDHKEGQRFYDFQRCLKEMQQRGIVLAINSKNNETDVKRVFEDHPYMFLKEQDFAAKRINWQNKAANITEISTELNLTEESFIFIDDNPMERELVGSTCPEVIVPDFPVDTSTLRVFAEKLYISQCRPLRLTAEDLGKTEQYRAEAQRRQEFSGDMRLEDYISRLEIWVDIHRMREDELNRVAQLCVKTNQFNLTTKRYTASELAEMVADGKYALYTVRAGDKYGDSGLIGVVILKSAETVTEIDTFLMSCRVMGRMIEDVIMNELATGWKNKTEVLMGKYVPTAKNAPVRELYERLGFTLVAEENGTKQYELPLVCYEKKALTCFQSIKYEG